MKSRNKNEYKLKIKRFGETIILTDKIASMWLN